IPLPKFPSCVIAMIANKGKEIAANIFELHKKLLDIAAYLQLPILGFGASRASAEFNAQNQLIQIETCKKLIFKNKLYSICPIYPNVGPIIRITDPLQAKKDCCNALFSGACLLSLEKYSARYNQILELRSILYKKDVKNVDHQDDRAVYRFFCSSFLSQVINKNNEVIMETMGYLFFYSSITENLEILRNWPSDDDIKRVINHAYEQATALAKNVLGMIEEENCFTDECSQLTFILENASIGITNGKLEISVLVNQRYSYEAYINQRMERKVAALSVSGSNYRFNSSLVSFLSSNECTRP
ncbi:12297_t:CDS:2, partial [Gigaspora rosea]